MFNIILTGFHLRAAKEVLGITISQLSQDTDVSKITLSRLIRKTPNLMYLNCSADTVKIIQDYFLKDSGNV